MEILMSGGVEIVNQIYVTHHDMASTSQFMYHLKRCLYHYRCLYNYFYTIERRVFTASKKHLEGSFEIV